jgi:hypothetical protein
LGFLEYLLDRLFFETHKIPRTFLHFEQLEVDFKWKSMISTQFKLPNGKQTSEGFHWEESEAKQNREKKNAIAESEQPK